MALPVVALNSKHRCLPALLLIDDSSENLAFESQAVPLVVVEVLSVPHPDSVKEAQQAAAGGGAYGRMYKPEVWHDATPLRWKLVGYLPKGEHRTLEEARLAIESVQQEKELEEKASGVAREAKSLADEKEGETGPPVGGDSSDEEGGDLGEEKAGEVEGSQGSDEEGFDEEEEGWEEGMVGLSSDTEAAQVQEQHEDGGAEAEVTQKLRRQRPVQRAGDLHKQVSLTAKKIRRERMEEFRGKARRAGGLVEGELPGE